MSVSIKMRFGCLKYVKTLTSQNTKKYEKVHLLNVFVFNFRDIANVNFLVLKHLK